PRIPARPARKRANRLNCLSAGSVSLTKNFLTESEAEACLNCLSAGSVSLTVRCSLFKAAPGLAMFQLPFGWVCFSNVLPLLLPLGDKLVSIAFRLGLFL